jgi:protein-L-isoaspartate(D-aspartate) O-methyltransferase
MSNRSRRARRTPEVPSSSRMLDLLSQVELADKRLARAAFGLPWRKLDDLGHPEPTRERVRVLVRMLEALQLTGGETVLDVGTGAGYRAALLGKLALRVRSIESSPNVAAAARVVLERLGVTNVEVLDGDGSLGWPQDAPYDAIVVGCASPDVPNELLDQLKEGGRLVIPVGDAQDQLVVRLRRHNVAVESDTVAPCSVRLLATRGERRPNVPWLRAASE